MPKPFRIHKVRHSMHRAGFGYGHYISDLVFLDGVPTVVIEWAQTPEGEVPAVMVPLDPRRLQEFPPASGDYFYPEPIEDPRKLD